MDINDILKQLPIDGIAEKLGVSPDVAQDAVRQGGGALLAGLAQNAQTSEGSAAIQKALGKHEGFAGAASVDDIDEADGAKILTHVFGDKEQDVKAALNNSPQTAGGFDFGKLLPMLAPVIMGFIANSMKGKSAEAAAQADAGGGLGDLLGGLLGGGGNSGGGGITDMLGGLLGGSNDSGGGGLGGLLGGLLGGGKN